MKNVCALNTKGYLTFEDTVEIHNSTEPANFCKLAEILYSVHTKYPTVMQMCPFFHSQFLLYLPGLLVSHDP